MKMMRTMGPNEGMAHPKVSIDLNLDLLVLEEVGRIEQFRKQLDRKREEDHLSAAGFDEKWVTFPSTVAFYSPKLAA